MNEITRLGWAAVCLAAILALGMFSAPCARADTYFTRTSDIWNNPVNWSAGLPTSGTNAYIGYAGKTNPATAAIHAGDNCAVSNLYIGKVNSSLGGLNMDGGSLTANYFELCDNNGTGIVMQTGGVIVDGYFQANPDAGAGLASWTITGQGTIVSNLSATASVFPYRGSGAHIDVIVSNNASMVGGTLTMATTLGGTGTLTLASGGAYSAPTGKLTVGNGGEGNLVVSNATLNTGTYGITAASGGIGHIRFVNASATIGGTLQLASAGSADMIVTDSAVTNSSGLDLGANTGSKGTFAMTNGYWFQGSEVDICGHSQNGNTGILQIANATWVQRNGVFFIGQGGNNSFGQLIVTNNSLLDARSNTINVGQASPGSLIIMDSTVLCSNINPVSGTGGSATMTIGGAAVVTNYGGLTVGYTTGPALANITMTGGTWWQAGQILMPNNVTGETGTLAVVGGSFQPQSSVTVAGSGGTAGSLILSNVAVALPSTLTVGSGGTGTVIVANGSLSVAGTCTFGNSAGAGQGAVLVMTNSAVTNWGAVYVSQNSAAVSSINQIGGSWSVISSNVYFGSIPGNSAGGAASYVVSNGVFQQIGGAFFLGSKTNFNCPAWVELDGTQRQFQVAAFTNYAYGVFSNNIAQLAGGLDITSTSSNALSIASTGVVALVYVQDPVAVGNYWGLRWVNATGTNHVAALQALTNAVPPRLIWNDSALSSYYTNQINIYTGSENSVAYTYVGIRVTTVFSKNKGTTVFFR